MVTSDFLTECPEAAVKEGTGSAEVPQVLPDRWKGMSSEQLSAIYRQRVEQCADREVCLDHSVLKHFTGSLSFFMDVWFLCVLCAEEETAGETEKPAMGFTATGAGQAASRGGYKSEGTGEKETNTTGPIQPAAGQRAAGTVSLTLNLISICCDCSACDYPGRPCQHAGRY